MSQQIVSEVWFPLSAAQLSRWFEYQLTPGSQGLHNNVFAARIHGKCDVPALATALRHLVARHPMLRVRFRHLNDQPEQCVCLDLDPKVVEIDASGMDDATLRLRVAADSIVPFDLASGTPIRVTLYRCRDEQNVILLAFDHIVGDGWSYWQIVEELGELLANPTDAQAAQDGRAAGYLDYVTQQKQWLSSPAGEAQLLYWKKALAGEVPQLKLETDRPRAPHNSGPRASHTLYLEEPFSAQLQALAKSHACTMYTVLLCAYQILLHRVSQQNEVVVGSPMPGRSIATWDRVIGDFVNVIALRSDFSADPSIAQLLRKVRDTVLRGMLNQDLPLTRLIELMRPSTAEAGNGLFQTMFVMQNARRSGGLLTLWSDAIQTQRVTWAGFEISPFPIQNSGGNGDFALMLEAVELHAGVRCDFRFDTSAFDESSVVALAARYRRILQAMVADTHQHVSRVAILGESERQWLVDLNATLYDFADHRLLHQRFEDQVRQHPERPAVLYESTVLCYAELNRRANQVAHYLRAQGVGPDDRVAVCMKRGPDMIVGLFGVLKAGGAYVPLDPVAPEERLAYMLDDCAARVVLTQAHLTHRLPAERIPVFALDDNAGVLKDLPGTDLEPNGLRPDHLAYVIYTSGSTGMPKGVMVEHASIGNLLSDWGRRHVAHVQSTPAVGSFWSSFAFDASVFEIFVPLTVGGVLDIAPDTIRLETDKLVDWLCRREVVHAYLPAFLIRALSEFSDEQIGKLSLQLLMVGAESLSEAALHRLQALLPKLTIVNAYGPTEATVLCTAYVGVHDVQRMAPIGRPIANARIYILDKHRQMVPPGVTGEIFIAGACLSRGYLNRPELSFERFFDDPFSSTPGARMYRSGDLGRWLKDGDIEFVGRNDFQIKLRGFRVEAGEVESALLACEGVREALVIARTGTEGDARLVAYLVPQAGALLEAMNLRQQLGQRLPDYMVPSAFVMLPEFPLTTNGKIDRGALPEPDLMSIVRPAFVAPRGSLERAVSLLWEELLGLNPVGRDDNFFALGGHSLLALQLVARIRQRFGVRISLRDLFTHSTLAECTKLVADAEVIDDKSISGRDPNGPLPLSFAQQRLWFLDRLDHAAGAAYHIAGGLRMTGRLDKSALQRALDRIVWRHEALRTTFVDIKGEAQQVIAPAGIGFLLPENCLDHLDGAAQETALAALAYKEATAAFDLASDRLIRGRLVCMAQGEHILLVTQHHIVSDGWSVDVMVRELGQLYAAFTQGLPDPLPPLPIQYADYAVWQRAWLQGEAMQAQVDFWKTQLQGAPALLALPTDRPRPAVQSHAGAGFAFLLDAALTAQLRSLAQRQGCTLFMVLLAGWSVLLARMSGQGDLVIGTPVANRQRQEIESLIGFFVNTLALRLHLEDDPTVEALLAQVKATTLAAYSHQDLPFEQVVEALNPSRSMSHSPIFQVVLSMNNTPGQGALALPALSLDMIEQVRTTSQFDLSLALTDDGDVIRASMEYARDLFDAATIERLAGHLQTVLGSMVANIGQRVSAVALMAEQEKQHMLVEWNQTALARSRDLTMARLFARQAALTPNATALVCGAQSLSYAELARQANRFADGLRARGIGPGHVVGLCVERSPEMVIGILAILEAGAAYLPLDPGNPAQRLAYMLQDTEAPLVLTQQSLAGLLPAHLPCLCLDGETEPHEDTGVDVTAHRAASAQDLAYVIYTSGSTGLPKGVAVQHDAALNLLEALKARVYEGRHDLSGMRVGWNASFAFDASVQQLLPLLAGATLYLAEERMRTDPHVFVTAMREWDLDVIDCTPTQLKLLLDEAKAATFPSIVLVGGEPIDPVLWQRIQARSGSRFFNVYGPTETTVDAVACEIGTAGPIPVIGRPLANVRVYLLDAHLQPVPIGVAGALYIAGDGLARGYVNDPERTEERFIPDPFSTQPGARMYRSGDIGRYLADGRIECLGRDDHQVKIRGFRIELGEIEARLARCPGVLEAIVIDREDVPGDKRLVAYLIAQEGEQPSVAELRAHLAQCLADYMIPSAFVMLDAYPLTSNGKLDRKALPAPDQSALARSEFEAPRGATESSVASIWQALLGLEQVSRHDNFFELGGHSLMAIGLIERLRQHGLSADVRTVFEAPTLLQMAARLDATKAGDIAVMQPAHAMLTAILPAPRSASLPLSFAQQRLWFLDRLDHAAGAAYHIAGGIRFKGTLDKAALQRALNRIVERHEALRTTFVDVDGSAQQVIAPAGIGFSLPETCLGNLDGAAQQAALAALAHEEATLAFDLASDRLIRGRLVYLSATEQILFVTQHHIVSDGWSVGVMVRELGQLYAAFSQGLPDPLPPLPIQYADYAIWQRQWLQGEAMQAQVDFWKTQLQGAPALLALPTDRSRPAVQSHAGAGFAFTLDAALTAQLRSLAQRQGCTLFMVLLAGWSVLLARMSGQGDLVIGTPVANRQRQEIESLIGFFVNTLALRLHLEDDPTVEALLAQVKATTLAAYSHQDLPFEQVVEVLKPARSMSHSPIFQVVLSMNNTPQDALVLPELSLDMVEQVRTTSQFDLSLALTDDGDVIRASMEYARDLFDAATIERLAGHLQTVLGSMVADIGQRVSAVALLDENARAQLLAGFNRGAPVVTSERMLHQRFEQHAAVRGDAIAVAFEDEHLTYTELNRRANRLAHYLGNLGVGRGARVALCMERGVDMVVAVLGILKAGAAYVPMDPAYPAERLAYMLGDSAPALLLTDLPADEAARLAPPGVAVAQFSALWPTIALCPGHDPDALALGLQSNDLAYIIYTSGSTGMPKGVMVEHANMARLFDATDPWFSFHEHDVWTLFHSLAFDFSVWELWGALAYGGKLVVVPSWCARSAQDFYALLCAHEVTVLNQTPSAFRQLIQAQAGSDQAHSLRVIVFGGEALELHTLAPWIERNDPERTRLVNMYGITEITVHATYRVISAADVEAGLGSVIGVPLPDLQMYILDQHLQPVPVGVAGELHIGGAGVARGYLNRPDLSATRFIDNPFAADTRLYKTGDMGRWLADGQLEYLGRNDFQVKIRGFRIELGEIEARLACCPGVREAIVIAREDVPGDKRLVAYLISQEGAQPSVAELRAHLAQSLADYMIPSAFVMLDAYPLTSNGKLDRNALPAPDQSALVRREFEAPQGATESAVASIWQALLGLEQIGRHDNFFELGGHSLMAIGLIEKLRQHGLRADVRTVFEAPTLLEMAARLDSAQAERAFVVPPNLIAPDCVAITPAMLPLVTLTQDEIDRVAATVPGGAANIQDIYPLAPLQEGILFHHLLEGEGDAYLLRSMLRFDTRQRLDAFLAALQTVVARHDILRSAICWHGLSQPVQVVYRSATLPVQEVALSGDDPLLQLQRQSDPRHLRLDLQRAPLLKAFIGADPASDAWFLSLLNHHMIEDNYSLQLLFGEIQSLLAGNGDQLPPPLPYRNFIAQLSAVSIAEHEAYFRAQLGDIDEPTAPFGLLNVLGGNDAITQARMRLSGADARQLRDSARAHGVTVSTLFHVAYAQVLAKCSGRDDVVFGTVLSGRLQGNAGADRALGLFINTLPLCVSLADMSVQQLVADTFIGLGRLFEHEQAPLSLAQRCSGVAQGMPLFTALLNYRRMHLARGSQTLGEGTWEGIESLATEARTNYPIDFSVDDLGDDFCLTVRCAQGADADRVLGYLCVTLNVVADELARRPEQLLSTLDILPDGEKQRLLVDFNRTDTDFAHEQLIHRQFELQAAAQPGAPAVVYGDHALTYSELNRLANQLAHRLIALGIVADDRVALCVERSIEMVVGILGILKAGAAYVPLDPAQPPDRLAYMLNDCAPRALVTQTHLRADMPAMTVPVLAIDRVPDETADAAPTHNPDPTALSLRATHLAYVIYTSGSTGQAKGVMVEHRSAINFWTVLKQKIYCHCRPNTNVALNASFAFDMSLKGLLQLLSGHCVFIIPQEIRADGAALMDFLARHRIDGFDCTPSQLEVLLAAGLTERADYHPVCVLIGGEAISTQTWNRLRAATAIRFFNMYGPTECTVDATLGDIGQLGELPNIGYPVANSHIYLLDKAMQAVPIGVAGEIHIGGMGLARGYLGKPQLSAERFVPDLFSTDPAARLYKTGDLGRWMPDGKIEYLGRNDFQVKLRGFRIELGEIETRLRDCHGVSDAVVVARHDVAGDQRLVAYLLMAASRTLSIADVREQLLKDLPGYMVPSAFVTLEAFPLNANGKLDRRALPAPDFDAVGTRHYDAPQGEVEQAIATMWKEILRLERVGRNDHFFELGGHSLLVVQFITRVRQQFGVDIGINAVFRMPTLAALAGVITAETVAQFEASDIARIEAEMANMSEDELSAWLEQEERLA